MPACRFPDTPLKGRISVPVSQASQSVLIVDILTMSFGYVSNVARMPFRYVSNVALMPFGYVSNVALLFPFVFVLYWSDFTIILPRH